MREAYQARHRKPAGALLRPSTVAIPQRWPRRLLPQGDRSRLLAALQRFRDGANLTIGVLGGSISAGQGAIDAPNFPYWMQVRESRVERCGDCMGDARCFLGRLSCLTNVVASYGFLSLYISAKCPPVPPPLGSLCCSCGCSTDPMHSSYYVTHNTSHVIPSPFYLLVNSVCAGAAAARRIPCISPLTYTHIPHMSYLTFLPPCHLPPQFVLELQLPDGYKRVKVSNGAVPGTSSQYMSTCHRVHVPQNVDIVFLEYAVNDEEMPMPHMNNQVGRCECGRARVLTRVDVARAVGVLLLGAWNVGRTTRRCPWRT